jgi:hypothetical protein
MPWQDMVNGSALKGMAKELEGNSFADRLDEQIG